MTEKCKPIIITGEEKEIPHLTECIEISNDLIEKKLTGMEFVLKNGWRITFKNKRYAKELGVPMP